MNRKCAGRNPGGSAGIMLFSGSILQLREFVKDFWWRNRAEKDASDLELLAKRLELCERYGLTREELNLLWIHFRR